MSGKFAFNGYILGYPKNNINEDKKLNIDEIAQ